MVTGDGHVAILEFHRPPHNFFDVALISELADALEEIDRQEVFRSVLLCSEGRNFCAGANFPGMGGHVDAAPLYRQAVRLFQTCKPIVAAIQGSAIGGGLGLALVADFRVVSASTRISANFCKLGIHPGFGLTHTLPAVVGGQKAARLFYTGERIGGQEAVAIGLADVLAPEDDPRAGALALAREVAASAPLAIAATRQTLRHGLADAVGRAIEVELAAQGRHFLTEDFREGVAAMGERRPPRFTGR